MNNQTAILAVDDTSESLALLVKLLTQAGYHVYPADSGELALAAIKANPPDLILLDIRMKGMDGLEVCRQLKASPETSPIPIILISAFADEKEWVTGLQLGAADYITKPFKAEELLMRVKTHLGLQQANQSLEQQTATLRQVNDQLQIEILERKHAEDVLQQNLDRANRSRQAMLSALEDQKRAERALQESEKKFRDLFNAMGEGLALHQIVYSTSGDAINYFILDVNPAFERILGVKKADAVNRLATDLYRIPDAPYLEEYAQVAKSGQAMFFEAYFAPMDKHFRIGAFSPETGLFATVFEDISIRKEQENKILASRAELQELLNEADKARRALLSVVEDQKIAEEEIRRLNAELEQRVADRTAQLEASNKELEAFAYSVSHDLRAPLRAIDGFSHILQEEYHQSLDGEALRLLEAVRENTARMDKLITGLLSLSRVGRIEMRYTLIDMASLVNSIYREQATPEILKKSVFRVGELPDAYGDHTLIRQVWTNLIANAIKYSLPKQECVIEIDGAQKDGQCIYSIKDNGVGFNPRYTSKLFGVFQRLHKAGDFEGTGVGLAIVQRIIHLHGGRVWGEGQTGVGATFYFTIPRRQVDLG